MDLESGRAVAVEAPARWQHPERGLLGPQHFIAAAESSGLIVPLGRWALAQACREIGALGGDAAGLDVAVNLSAHQLTGPDVLAHVKEALAENGLPARRLVLEVTESAFIADEEGAAEVLDDLSALGVRIALDDFGTGYSSLLYLPRYPIDAVKLDRTFVSGMLQNADDEAICSSVVSLSHAVGATSVAEGVEIQQQCATLRGYGCQQAPGFLWSPAVAVVDLPRVLAACARVPLPPRTLPVPAAPPPLSKELARRIATLHSAGASLHTIAEALNRAGTSNPDGTGWTAAGTAHYVVT